MFSEDHFHGYTPIASGNQIYMERPKIHRLLEKAVQNQIVSVVAGAGYGKTHAVYSFVRRYNARTAWMQCSEHDNIGERFWDNFVSAVSKITEQPFDSYLEIPKNSLNSNEKYIFVYDDLHLITEKTVLQFLERYICSSFPNICFILISRLEPPFNLSRNAARKKIARISGNDLRFNKNEMVSYFELQGINPSPDTVSAIYHDTEGWAFAIHLAALLLKNSPDAAYVPQALRSNIYNLIESEIMSGLSVELRRFLIKLSLIEDLDLKFLEEIETDRSLITKMEETGPFIYFDTYQNSYRIHHLFLEYLRERQDELSEKERRELWNKAAIYCMANNRKIDAIINYEKAGDYKSIAGILYSLPLVIPEQTGRFILDVLNRAGESISREHPEIGLIRKRVLESNYLNMGFISRIVPHSAEAMGGNRSGMLELAQGENFFFRAELGEAEKLLLEAVEKARKMEQSEIENCSLFYLLRIYLSQGKSIEIENIIKGFEERPGKMSYLDIFSGWYYSQIGKKDQIALWLKREYTGNEKCFIACGLERMVRAKHFFSEKRYPAALSCLKQLANLKISLMGSIGMTALEAVCRYRLGDREGAFTALAQACRLAAPSGFFMSFAELGKDMRTLAEAAIRDHDSGGSLLEDVPVQRLREIRRSAADYAKKLYSHTRQGSNGLNGELLSNKEKEVLFALSQGLTMKEIAGAASISPNTVKSIKRSIFNKLGALNRSDAVRIAAEKGIL
ncbi:MAG: LuxR C-terminal-related transcriptional regulator [Treponema sp.]|nr:LuxR C-terminal-related transcriptional regulator [Treponema sp.]